MYDTADYRDWIETDRPGERLAVSHPLPGVQLVSVRDSDRPCCEYHDEFRICLIHPSREVSAAYRCRGAHEVVSGDLMAFEPGDHHVTTRITGGKADYSVVSFSPATLQEAADELGSRGVFHYKDARLRCPRVARALLGLVAASARGEGTLALEIHRDRLLSALIEGCAERPLPLRRTDPVPHFGIRIARNHLREHFAEQHKLDDLAKMAGMSRFAFSHAFTRYVGISPHAYLRLRRVIEARKLIGAGMPISDVAFALGYADVALLTRTFKRYFGVPPARWRRCVENNQQFTLPPIERAVDEDVSIS